MRSRGVLLLGALLGARAAGAQAREPLCVVTEARRWVGAPYLRVNGSDRVVARPFAALGAGGEAFAVAVRDPDHALRVGDARRLARTLDELELGGRRHGPDRQPGLTVLRVGRDLGVLGEGVFLPDPVRGERGEETYPPGIPVGVTVERGVLVIEHVAGDLWATVVPPVGAIEAPRRVAEAPGVVRAGAHRGFVWLTAVARDGGAIALAGTDEGEVVSVVFDRAGARVGAMGLWSTRVGGAMQLVPVPEGTPPVAVLERPVRGTTQTGTPAREQVLVRLRENLEPVGEPERLGLGPYATAAVLRGGEVVLTQWAEARGLALAALPVRDARVAVQTPRLWTTRPFEGVPLGHAAVRTAGNVVYDLMLHGDDVAGGLHAYLTYVPPAGVPVSRPDVLPLRARVIAGPELLPADDGVVVVLQSYDETGGGVDAVHLRCELVTLPPR